MFLNKHNFLILLTIILKLSIYEIQVEALESPHNVCKTFEGYYTNKDCYYNPDQLLEVPDIVKRHGYPIEEHDIKTEDGYYLKIFRIPSNDTNSKPVLLQHAILASSVNFLITGNNSLGFTLADAGYDVWLGNFRGTKYSRNHDIFKSDTLKYWDFSFDELGRYDTSSTINLIRNLTQKPIIYIGYSLGSVAGHVYSSLYPEEAEKSIKVMISLAPAALLETSRSILRFFRPFWSNLQKVVNTYNHGELFERDGPLIKYIRSVCFPYPHQLKMCLGFIQLAFGLNEDQINPETLPVTLYHDGESISMKTVIHLSQVAASRKFRMYDYGKKYNLKKYNSSEPPVYNLTSILVPNHLIYGTGDFVVTKKAVSELYKQFSKNGKKYGVYAVKDPNFAHTDFIIGKNVKTLVYDHILNFLKKIENDK